MAESSQDKQLLVDYKNNKKASIEIQYCISCETHPIHHNYTSLKYQSLFDNIKTKFSENGITVKKRQVPRNLHKKSPYYPANIYFCSLLNKQVCFPQIASFEVYFNDKKIYSKLQSGKFPSVDYLLGLVYKCMLEKGEKAFPGKKRRVSKQKIASNLIQRQRKINSIDVTNFQKSKQRYMHWKQSLQTKEVVSIDSHQKRPNTMHIYRRSFQIKSRGSRREYHSRQNQKTNEQALIDSGVGVSLNIKQTNNKQLRFMQGWNQDLFEADKIGTNAKLRNRFKYEKTYNVYLQSLIPKKHEKSVQFQSHKVRLRKKLQDYWVKHDLLAKGVAAEQKADRGQERQVKQGQRQVKQQRQLDNDELQQKILYADLLQNMEHL